MSGSCSTLHRMLKIKSRGDFMKIFLNTIFVMTAWSSGVYAQTQDSTRFWEPIAVAARPYADSIVLRWAPLKGKIWQQANKNGYIIERYVMARNGKVLQQPEKIVLTPSPLKPLPLEQWQNIIRRDKYHAIAAQALFGDRFEVDMSKSDVFTIVNKVKENEQRFTFALFSADMSPLVAKASGLWFTDKKVVQGEKYLYRILISQNETIRGSIFISPDDIYELPKPLNLVADFKDQLVSLRWDKNSVGKYTAYIIERSTDGKVFQSISDTPLVTMSPTDHADTRYEYAIDSLQDISKTYHYRVKGITPFGEESKPSDVASGKGATTVADVPYISSGENIDNKSIRIIWDFPEKNNSSIKGFSVERSSKPQGNYIPLTLQSPIPPAGRMYEDKMPQNVNYYRVTALGLNGEKYSSPIYLAQLIDSIPPATPAGLKATINEFGSVELSWQQNKDSDLFGYRIYRSNVSTEEPSQITSEPVVGAYFKDNVNVNTLNEAVYYSVMAIDKNQNHSGLSELLKVSLPDKIKPQPPVFLPVKSDEKGVLLEWIRSGSEDVVQYDIYRKASDRKEWQRLKTMQATQDSVFRYIDENAIAGKSNAYTVVAVDKSGLESDPATPVSAGKIDSGLRPQVQWKTATIIKEKNQVVLSWEYLQNGVTSFRIYRAIDEGSSVMYRTVSGDKREFPDMLTSGKKYKYKILAVFEGGAKSELSTELVTNY